MRNEESLGDMESIKVWTSMKNMFASVYSSWKSIIVFFFLLVGGILISTGSIDTSSLQRRTSNFFAHFSNQSQHHNYHINCPQTITQPPKCNFKFTLPPLATNVTSPPTCPSYFRYIHEDLRPWNSSGITKQAVENAKKHAAFRLVVIDGKAYLDKYHNVFQTRDIFTLWGILQLLNKYPGKVKDFDMMFNCEDMPVVRPSDYANVGANNTSNGMNVHNPLPPLFRYCKDDTTVDIVFPDWSFWGWPEVNIKPWVTMKKELEKGNKKIEWKNRDPHAYWKGNPWVSDSRRGLMECNLSKDKDWNARLYTQDWGAEVKSGFKSSDLSSQCTHRIGEESEEGYCSGFIQLFSSTMLGGSMRRGLFQRGTSSNQSRNVDASNSQHRDDPSYEEEIERDNEVEEEDEQAQEEDSITIPTQGYNPAIDPVTKKPPLEWKGNCFLNQKAGRIIGQIWSRRFMGPWFKYKLVPPEIRSILFDEFKKVITGKEPAFHESFQYWHVYGDPSKSLKNTKKISKSSAYVDNKSAKTMENYLKKKAESEEAMDDFNPQHWVDSSGGLTKGKMYGAPHLDSSCLHRGSRSSSADSHQRYPPAQPPSTQPMHTQYSIEEIGQWVLEKLMQSTIPTQSTVHMQTTVPMHVAVSLQPTVPTPPTIPAQSSMFTQATMPAHSQQMGFSPFSGTFPHMTGHISIPSAAYPSQHSPMSSNTARTTQQNMPFFDLMQQQYPFMQQFSHVQQFSQPSIPYQTPCNFEENQDDGGME